MASLDELLSIHSSQNRGSDDRGSENHGSENDNDSGNGSIHEVDSMPPPPEDQSFDTMQEALGYALTTKSSQSKNGAIVVKYLQCDRGGAYRSRIDGDRRCRQDASHLNGCPFRAVLRYYDEFDAWHLRVDNPRHNHEPSPVSIHPTLRHRELSAKSSQIENQLQQGVSTRQIMRGLHQTGESGLKAQDIIYNLRKDLRKKFLEGKTPIQASITTARERRLDIQL
jgi:hypothetical protein